MKNLIALFACAPVLFAAARVTPTSLWGPAFSISTSTGSAVSLNAAGARAAIPIYVGTTKTLSTFAFPGGTLSGSTVAADVQCTLFSNDTTTNKPLTSLEGPKAGSSLAATVGATCGTFTTSLSPGTLYWMVIANNNGTPVSNFFRVATGVTYGVTVPPFQPVPSYTNLQVLSSTDSGSTWGVVSGAVPGAYEATFTDGSHSGFPLGTSSSNPGSTYGSFGSQEGGVQFTTPANFAANVSGVCMNVITSGTPTGDLTFRLYTSTSSFTSTAALPVTQMNSSQSYRCLPFAVVQSLSASTTYWLTAHDSAADSSANYYGIPDYAVFSSTAFSDLIPYGAVQTVFNGSSFSNATNQFVPFALLLDSGNEFAAGTGTSQVGYAY